jgi:AraC-like DNA-binding protein
MTRRPRKEGTRVTSRSAAAEHLRDLVWLRRVRDRIDREYAQPLDLQALARGAHTSAGHLSRQFRAAYGESPYGYLMTRRIGPAMALLGRGDLRSPRSASRSPNRFRCRCQPDSILTSGGFSRTIWGTISGARPGQRPAQPRLVALRRATVRLVGQAESAGAGSLARLL